MKLRARSDSIFACSEGSGFVPLCHGSKTNPIFNAIGDRYVTIQFLFGDSSIFRTPLGQFETGPCVMIIRGVLISEVVFVCMSM